MRKMTFKIVICSSKLITGRTLEIWQLDVLVIIYIKNSELKLDFHPYLKLLYSVFALLA